MKKTMKLVLGLALAAGAAAAQAQSTLGALLDQGARKLASTAEIQALGDMRIVRQSADSDAYVTLRADGLVVGMVHNKQGSGSSEAVGQWTVDATGRRCADVALPAFNMNWKQCGYVYRLGGDIYMAPSDSDRSATVTAYTGPAFLKQ
jgi:hypothetical protein